MAALPEGNWLRNQADVKYRTVHTTIHFVGDATGLHRHGDVTKYKSLPTKLPYITP